MYVSFLILDFSTSTTLKMFSKFPLWSMFYMILFYDKFRFWLKDLHDFTFFFPWTLLRIFIILEFSS